MKKLTLIIALFGAVSLAQATTTDLFYNVTCNNNSYSCGLPTIDKNLQLSDCTFTFSTISTSKGGYLSCDLFGNNGSCAVGTQNGSTTTWTCNLNSSCIDYVNNCLSLGKNCNFNLDCYGFCKVGDCKITYDCKPCPPQNVPDTSLTIALLGAVLLGVELARRKFAVAR